MIAIIITRGGIGNQMFCYAFYCAMRKISPFSYIELDIFSNICDHNGFELGKIFRDSIKLKKWKYYRRIHKIHSVFFTKHFFYSVNEISSGTFQNIRSKMKPLVVYNGFWQSERYFKKIEIEIRRKYTFNLKRLSKMSYLTLQELKTKNAVSIHIRRGDYLSHSENYGSICTLEYYFKAINYLLKIDAKIFFYIFSDDPSWTMKHLSIPNSKIIDFNKGEDSWQDMCLMANCNHNIIANSTFSWWGAWLNTYPSKIVVAPKIWMNNKECNDIVPSTWVRI